MIFGIMCTMEGQKEYVAIGNDFIVGYLGKRLDRYIISQGYVGQFRTISEKL